MATTEAITVELTGEPVEIIEPEHATYVHAAGDKIRLLVASGVFVVTLLAAAVFRSIISGAEQDVVYLSSLVPAPAASLLSAIAGVIGIVGPVGVVASFLLVRRWRVVGMTVAAGALAGAAMWGISRLLSVQVRLPANLGELRGISYPGTYPGTRFLAWATAIVAVLGPWTPRWVRRSGVIAIAIVAFSNIASGQYVPYEAVVAIVTGWLTGAIVTAIGGSPNRRPQGSHVAAALAAAGSPVRRLEMLGRGVRGSTVYRADTVAGSCWFIKVFSADQTDADLLVQLYRWVRLRDARDERPFSSLRRATEHEALLALKAFDDGVPTAQLQTLAEVDMDGMLLAFDYVEGESLEGAGPAIGDETLRQVWRVAATLRDHHIAHRDLRLTHFLQPTGRPPVVVDLGFGELAASPVLLRSDLAELLCSVALEVGARRAVATAVEVLGVDAIADMSPRLQPLALSAETRDALSRRDGLLEELQAEVQRAAGLEEVHYEELARIKGRTIVTLVVSAIALYALLPRLAEVSDIGNTLATADWRWLIPLVLFLVLTWVGATIAMMGSVPDRLPFVGMYNAQVAASFVDILAPAMVGGMALNTRYMQKRGVEPGVAVAGVGLNAIAGFIVHVVLLGVFILWAGSASAASSESEFRLPSLGTILLVLAGVVAAAGIALVVPYTRRLARNKLVPMARDGMAGMRDLARRPRKIVALFGGSVLVTMAFYGALVCSVEAFGGGVSPAQIGVVYLAAFAVASFFPTPGGLGALEAAMIAGFQRVGLGADAAVSSVFLFRIGTFWLPVLPGYISFGFLQRRNDI